MTPPHALILGANGRLGLAVAQAFTAAGWRVSAVLRHEPARTMPPSVRVLRTALQDTTALARQAGDARVVVHAANPVYTQWERDLLPAARAAMDLARRLDARLLVPGNVYNFGPGMPERLLADTPQAASDRKGRLRIRLEDELRARCDAGQLRATVIRAGEFYGAGSGSWFDTVIAKSVSKGRLVYPGPMNVAHAWAFVPDLARAFVAVAQREPGAAAGFERFHFAGHTMTGAELLAATEAAAQSLGMPAARGWTHASFPWTMLRWGGAVVPMWRELVEMRHLWQVPHALDGGALAAAVGPMAGTSPALALRAALLELGCIDRTVPGAAWAG
jgi:nucleoside-diphosphate-sugar epimerase